MKTQLPRAPPAATGTLLLLLHLSSAAAVAPSGLTLTRFGNSATAGEGAVPETLASLEDIGMCTFVISSYV